MMFYGYDDNDGDKNNTNIFHEVQVDTLGISNNKKLVYTENR
jgi:hypothetical protein